MLPVRGDRSSLPGVALIVDESAARLAPRLGLAAFDSERYAAAAEKRGCSVDDLGCSLPAAAASHNVTRGLGVSLNSVDGGTVVRAALLGVDGAPLARAEAAVDVRGADDNVGNATARAVAQAVDALASPAATATAKGKTPTSRTPRETNDDDDRVLEDFPCTIYRGIEAVGARCVLTRRSLRVTPHALNFQTHTEEIVIADLKRVEPYNPLGIPSGMRLTLSSGQTRELVVGLGPRDHLVRRVSELIR